METVFEYCDRDNAYFSSDERKWITRIRKLAEQHPSEVTILNQPETNDGCIYARLPVEYLKISPKRRVDLSDEQRLATAERLRLARKSIE